MLKQIQALYFYTGHSSIGICLNNARGVGIHWLAKLCTIRVFGCKPLFGDGCNEESITDDEPHFLHKNWNVCVTTVYIAFS
jgi:hypothetical protein